MENIEIDFFIYTWRKRHEEGENREVGPWYNPTITVVNIYEISGVWLFGVWLFGVWTLCVLLFGFIFKGYVTILMLLLYHFFLDEAGLFLSK